MSNIRLKRSAIPNRIPTIDQVELGELVINSYDGKLFLKKDIDGQQSIVELGASNGGGGSQGTTGTQGTNGSQGIQGISGGGSASWGSISGTLSNQTDLNTELGLKAPLDNPIFTGTATIPTINCVSITETSSKRYKENIYTLNNALDKVISLRGVQYNLKDNEVVEIGVIAEEIANILPEVIKYNNEGEPDSVSYGRLSAVFIEAIKQQQKQIELLKQEINLYIKNKL